MHNDSLDWNETAVRQAMDECDNVPYLMIGSMAIGAVALAFTNYFVAGALTLGGVALSQKKQNNAIARAEFAIKHNGSAVAARGNELKEYTESVGQNAAAEQLLHATQQGIPLNQDGWNLLEDHYGDRLDDLLEQTKTTAVGHRWFQPELMPPNSDTSIPTASAPPQSTPDEPNPITRLMHFFRLQNTLVWGGQGSGKTSLTREIAADKLAHNQKVIVLNPHGSASTWQGMKLIGAGKNYKAVEEFMRTYLALIKQRYQIFEQSGISEDDFLEQLLKAGLVESVICEEASSWAANVDQELLHDFTRTGLTESRKVGLPLLIVTHDPSLEFMGLKKGARLRDAGMAIAELEPGIADLDTGFLKATGRGKLQLPGQKDAIAFVFEPPIQTAAPNPIDLRAVELPKVAPLFSASDIDEMLASPALTPRKIEDIAKAYGLPLPNIERSPLERLEDSFKLNAVEPTAIAEVPVTQNLFDNLPEPLDDVARYINSKGGELPVASLKNWGKSRRNGALNSDAIDDSLIELMQLQLIQTFTPIDSKGEWVRWIAT